MAFLAIAVAFIVGIVVGVAILAAAKDKTVDISVDSKGVRVCIGRKEKAQKKN